MSEPKVLNINTIGSQAAHAMEASGQAVYIGRRIPGGAWPQSKWANTYPVSRHGRDGAIKRFREKKLPKLLATLPELRGKDLLCWCAPEACHGDVLLELANATAPAAGAKRAWVSAAARRHGLPRATHIRRTDVILPAPAWGGAALGPTGWSPLARVPPTGVGLLDICYYPTLNVVPWPF
jgi:hypothetical protein